MNTKAMLPLTAISSSHFTWTGMDGVAEMSDLPEHLLSRVYRDACDQGFLCLNSRTGNALLFTEDSVIRNRDDEFMGWRFKDTKGLGFTIHILND